MHSTYNECKSLVGASRFQTPDIQTRPSSPSAAASVRRKKTKTRLERRSERENGQSRGTSRELIQRAPCASPPPPHTTQLSRTPKPKNKRLPRARVLYEERGEENGVHRLRRPEEQKTGCRVQGSFERKPKRSKEQNRRKRDSTKRGL